MVPLKRPFLFVIALACACVVAEIGVRLIGYPTAGIAKRYDMGRWGLLHFYKPYSKYWNVEAGNKVFARNNVGLSGIDVDTSGDNRFVFVLGSSYVEAYEVQPALVATSVLQKRLECSFGHVSVLNLGYSGYDPYQLYFVSALFEKFYKPHRVVLELGRLKSPWLRRYQPPLSFHIWDGFGKEPKRWWVQEFMGSLRNHSVLINIIKVGFGAGEIPTKQSAEQTEGMNEVLAQSLEAFQERYGSNFICVSIDPDSSQNRIISAYCHNRGIHFLPDATILTPANRIGGKGHLNETGNRLFGELLYKAYVQFDQEP